MEANGSSAIATVHLHKKEMSAAAAAAAAGAGAAAAAATDESGDILGKVISTFDLQEEYSPTSYTHTSTGGAGTDNVDEVLTNIVRNRLNTVRGAPEHTYFYKPRFDSGINIDGKNYTCTVFHWVLILKNIFMKARKPTHPATRATPVSPLVLFEHIRNQMIDHILQSLDKYPLFFAHILQDVGIRTYTIFILFTLYNGPVGESGQLKYKWTSDGSSTEPTVEPRHDIPNPMERLSKVSTMRYWDINTPRNILDSLKEWYGEAQRWILRASTPPNITCTLKTFPGTPVEKYILYWNDVIRTIFPTYIERQNELNRNVTQIMTYASIMKHVITTVSSMDRCIQQVATTIVGEVSDNRNTYYDWSLYSLYLMTCEYLVSGKTINPKSISFLIRNYETKDKTECKTEEAFNKVVSDYLIQTSTDTSQNVLQLLLNVTLRRFDESISGPFDGLKNAVTKIVSVVSELVKKSDISRSTPISIESIHQFVHNYTDSKRSLNELTEEISRINTEIQGFRKENERILSEIASLDTTIQNMRDECIRLDKAISSLTIERDTQTAAARTSAALTAAEEKNLDDAIKKIDKQIKTLKERKQTTQLAQDRESETKATLDRTKSALNRQIQELSVSLGTTTDEKQKLEKNISDIRSKITSNLDRLSIEITKYKQELDDQIENFARVRKQVMFTLTSKGVLGLDAEAPVAGAASEPAKENLPTTMLRQLITSVLYTIGFDVLDSQTGSFLYDMEKSETECAYNADPIECFSVKKTELIHKYSGETRVDPNPNRYIFRLNRYFHDNAYVPLALILLRYIGWNGSNPAFPIEPPEDVREWVHVRLNINLTDEEKIAEMKDLKLRRTREKQVYIHLNRHEEEHKRGAAILVRELLQVINVSDFVTDVNTVEVVNFVRLSLPHLTNHDVKSKIASLIIDYFETHETLIRTQQKITEAENLSQKITSDASESPAATAAAAAAAADRTARTPVASSTDSARVEKAKEIMKEFYNFLTSTLDDAVKDQTTRLTEASAAAPIAVSFSSA